MCSDLCADCGRVVGVTPDITSELGEQIRSCFCLGTFARSGPRASCGGSGTEPMTQWVHWALDGFSRGIRRACARITIQALDNSLESSSKFFPVLEGGYANIATFRAPVVSYLSLLDASLERCIIIAFENGKLLHW